MQVDRIADGFWRWTAPHPAWQPDGSGADEWPQHVGCIYYEAPTATVLVDPQAPPEGTDDARRFWQALDRDVERRGLPVAIALTSEWHARSSPQVMARYEIAPMLPDGVDSVTIEGDPGDETMIWIAEHGALVPGDVLIAFDGPLRVCPPSWYAADAIRYYHEDLRAALEPFLALPVERVLVSHGEPVMSGAKEALRRAVEAL